jgi:hypothetical protein
MDFAFRDGSGEDEESPFSATFHAAIFGVDSGSSGVPFVGVFQLEIVEAHPASKMPNKSRQINRRDARGLDGFRRLGVLLFIHDFSRRRPAVSALWRSAENVF